MEGMSHFYRALLPPRLGRIRYAGDVGVWQGDHSRILTFNRQRSRMDILRVLPSAQK